MKITISFRQGTLFSIPDSVDINGVKYSLDGTTDGQFIFVGPEQHTISFVSFPSSNVNHTALLPREIFISGRPYIRRCENFYTPRIASPSDIERFFDHISSQYESTIDLRLNETVIARMLAAAEKYAKRRQMEQIQVLDFGCGTGLSHKILNLLSPRLGRKRKIILNGCDLSERMVEHCKQNGFYNVSKCEYSRTGFASESFDFIFCSFVVHYFVDRAPFAEIERLLRPGGLLLFNLPQDDFEEREFYRTILREKGNGKSLVQFGMWTISTSKQRKLPVIRYTPQVLEQTRRSRRRRHRPVTVPTLF